MRVTDSVIVRAPPQEVWAWWRDFGHAGDVARVSHGLAWSRRRVVERERDRVVWEEEVPLLPVRARLVRTTVTVTDEGARRLHETGEGLLRFEADWAFAPHERGTRVVRTVEVAPGWTRLVPRVLARWVMGVDLRHHARACERDLRRAPGRERRRAIR